MSEKLTIKEFLDKTKHLDEDFKLRCSSLMNDYVLEVYRKDKKECAKLFCTKLNWLNFKDLRNDDFYYRDMNIFYETFDDSDWIEFGDFIVFSEEKIIGLLY